MAEERRGAPNGADDASGGTAGVSPVVLEKASEFIEAEEGAFHRHRGWLAALTAGIALAMALFHLWAVYDIVPAQILRPVHVGFALVLIFLLFPAVPRLRDRVTALDWLAAFAAVASIAYLILGGEELADRSTLPETIDVAFGIVFLALLLEASRRSSGIVMPIIATLFLAYALFGQYLPPPWLHRGYDVSRLVGQLYITLEGVFGSAVDVSATLIILFTLFGAVLQQSGAGKFFIDFAFAATGGRTASAGRAVTLASFLLGGPSGSGVATTVTIGAVAYPMLARAGYGKAAAGGLLAAGGLGAILSPPVLGAAAFLIAEYLRISYLEVVRMALVPTCLYYFALFVMVEIDARRHRPAADSGLTPLSMGELLRRQGFHFVALISVVVFMLMGYTPERSVFFAMILAIAASFLDRANALWPGRLAGALIGGAKSMLNIAATCAIAGIIVGVVTLTGLGLKFSSIVIDYAGGSLPLTALYTALIVWIVGLAVPVTASYIICAVIAAPAMIRLGVPDFAAHMFIFYYAVLSEVSPPTALSPFAAAALTGADPYRTTLQSWKYALPAFLVPFVFVLDPAGVGLLLVLPKGGTEIAVVWIILTTTIGIAALAAATQGYFRRPLGAAERGLLIAGGALLLFPSLVQLILPAAIGGLAAILWLKAAGLAFTVLAGLRQFGYRSA